VARPREGERSREPRDASSTDDELHVCGNYPAARAADKRWRCPWLSVGGSAARRTTSAAAPV
jgi:hypothetical protein